MNAALRFAVAGLFLTAGFLIGASTQATPVIMRPAVLQTQCGGAK